MGCVFPVFPAGGRGRGAVGAAERAQAVHAREQPKDLSFVCLTAHTSPSRPALNPLSAETADVSHIKLFTPRIPP